MTMTTTTQQTGTLGSQYLSSDVVTNSIDAIVNELRSRQAHITEPKGPDSENRVHFDELAAMMAKSRGRGLYYDYISSGLGNGALVELIDGSVKWDMINGIGVHFFGHSEPELVRAALEASTGDTVMQGHLQMNEDAIRYANQRLLEELLPVIDNFEMGMQAASKEQSSMIYVGMDMVRKQLTEFLSGCGVSEIPSEGKPFDPNVHEAVAQEVAEGVEDGAIIRVMRRGFMLRDRLLRPATVVVAQSAEQTDSEDN